MQSKYTKIHWQSIQFYKPFLIFLLTSIIYAYSCKKDESYVIEGKITEINTNKGIPNCTIQFYKSNISNGIYSAGYAPFQVIKTDNFGNYRLEISEELFIKLKLTVNKENYFQEDCYISLEELKKENKLIKNIEITPEAELSILIFNDPPYITPETINIWYHSSPKVCPDCCTNEEFTYTGIDLNENITCKTSGNAYSVIRYRYTKNGNNFYQEDSVFCPAFKTTSIKINF